MLSHPKEACISCHFFARRRLDAQLVQALSVSADERKMLTAGDYTVITKDPGAMLECWMKVWSPTTPIDEEKLFDAAVKTNRKDFCFYWPYHHLMSLDAGQTLQKRAAEAREASRDRRLTIYGLWIAGIALAISTAVQVREVIVNYFRAH